MNDIVPDSVARKLSMAATLPLIISMSHSDRWACYWSGDPIEMGDGDIMVPVGKPFKMDGFVSNPHHEDYFWGHQPNIEELAYALDDYIRATVHTVEIEGFGMRKMGEGKVWFAPIMMGRMDDERVWLSPIMAIDRLDQ